jgi:hypothetical protein
VYSSALSTCHLTTPSSFAYSLLWQPCHSAPSLFIVLLCPESYFPSSILPDTCIKFRVSLVLPSFLLDFSSLSPCRSTCPSFFRSFLAFYSSPILRRDESWFSHTHSLSICPSSSLISSSCLSLCRLTRLLRRSHLSLLHGLLLLLRQSVYSSPLVSVI